MCIRDSFQVGCIGLIKAIDNFDLAQNVKFSTYAVPMIIGAVSYTHLDVYKRQAVIYLLFVLLRPFLEDKKWQKLWRMELLVAWQGKEKIVPAFLDTGNRLRDPFSSLPVIVIDYRSLEGLLPPPVYRCLADGRAEPWSALEQLSDPALARCFTLIPCREMCIRDRLRIPESTPVLPGTRRSRA